MSPPVAQQKWLSLDWSHTRFKKENNSVFIEDIISICYLQASNFSPGGSEVRPLCRSPIAYPETGIWQVT
jgi:hypothetical protein